MEANKIKVVDDQGNEIEFEVLFTFDDEDKGKKYVLYYDPSQEETNVFASIYDDEGKLYEIETPEEWEMIEEVFQTFVANEEGEEESGCGCGCNDSQEEGCGCNDDDSTCCGGSHDEGCGCN